MSDTSGNNGCGSSTGGPIPGTKKRNIIPGFNPPDTLMHQYAPAWPAGEIFTRCNVPTKTPLDASLNSNQFSLKVGSRETVRFEPDTFSVDYAILVKNPDYFGTPEQIKKWQTDNNTTSLPPKIHLTEKIPIQSRKLKHPYVIPPCLGGRALFESCRVVLDGIEIPSPRLNDVGILHQQISRTFASPEILRESLGRVPIFPTNSDDHYYKLEVQPSEGVCAHPKLAATALASDSGLKWGSEGAAVKYKPGAPATMSKYLEEAFESTHFHENETKKTMFFGFESQFPFSCQSHSARSWSKNRYESPFLRPLSEIFVELNKTIPLNRYFSRINVSDKAVGGEEDFPTDNDFDGMEIKILGLKMHYLSYQLTSNVFIHKMIKDTYYYIYELPECRTSLLMADTTSETIRFSVPPGVRHLALAFANQTQQTPGGPSGTTPQIDRCFWPPHSRLIKLNLPGRNGLINHEGLKNPATSLCNSSDSMILYHTDLVRQDIYREPFTRWSPSPVEKTRPGSTVAKLPCLAYNGVIQLFPNNIWFDKTTELEVVIEYEKASKPRWRVILFTEKQMLAMYSALNKWIMNDMPKPSALKSDSDRVG